MHRGQRAPGESSSASDERPVANNRSAVMACADKSCADESCRAARRGHCCRARLWQKEESPMPPPSTWKTVVERTTHPRLGLG